MARGRSRRSSNEYAEFWPGYVDVLSTLLLVVTFLLSIFMLSQFFVSQEASGKDNALRRLTRQLAELTSLLSLEKGKGRSIEDELASLQASLASLKAENQRLTGVAGLGDKSAGEAASRVSSLSKELADEKGVSNEEYSKSICFFHGAVSHPSAILPSTNTHCQLPPKAFKCKCLIFFPLSQDKHGESGGKQSHGEQSHAGRRG